MVSKIVKTRYEEHADSILVLGSGAYGSVFKVYNGKEVVAVKIVDLSKEVNKYQGVLAHAKKWLEYYYQELVDSEFVVKVKKSYLDDKYFCIEMEYCNGKRLTDLMHYQLLKKELLPCREVWKIFLLLLKGINGFDFSECELLLFVFRYALKECAAFGFEDRQCVNFHE
jgi:serine/threonine protein kinase